MQALQKLCHRVQLADIQCYNEDTEADNGLLCCAFDVAGNRQPMQL